MKKTILSLGMAAFFVVGSATFIGCGNAENNESEHMEHMDGEHHEHAEGDDHDHSAMEMSDEEHAQYQCPMKCEGDKTYDEAGECPKCGMDLKEVE